MSSASDDLVGLGYAVQIPRHGWSCAICGKTFRWISEMRRHIEGTHSDNYSYTCPFASCGKMFKVEQNRQVHVRKVHGMTLTCIEIRGMIDTLQGSAAGNVDMDGM